MTKSEFFDRVSTSKDPLLFTEADRRKVQKLKERLDDLTDERVIEPGCGVGPLTEYLSKWVGPEGRVLAFDVSQGMVEQCRARLGHLHNVDILHATAETVKLQRAAWDLAILFRVFPHFENKPAVLRRLRPSLGPCGRLVIANLEGSAQINARHARFSEAVCHDHMPCAQETAQELEKSGFRIRLILDTDEEFYAEATPL